MERNKEKELKGRISKTKNLFEEMTGRRTSFKVEGNEGNFVYDESSGKFVREKSVSQWMADNPKRWMADNPSEQRGERVVVGVKASPSSVSSYSQKFENGKLIEEGNEESDIRSKRNFAIDEFERNQVARIEEVESETASAGSNYPAIVAGTSGVTFLAGASAYIIKNQKDKKKHR